MDPTCSTPPVLFPLDLLWESTGHRIGVSELVTVKHKTPDQRHASRICPPPSPSHWGAQNDHSWWEPAGSSKKQESSRKASTSALLTMPKPLTVWITINCGKSWKRWEYQTTWPASWEICMQVRKQQLKLDMEHRLVPNRKRSPARLYIVTLLIELLCRVHHEKCWAGRSTSWNQDC